MNMNIGKSFLSSLSRKTFYLMTLFTLLALAAVGFFVVPSFNNSGTASAAKVEAGAGQKVTAEMLRWALDFRSGTEYRVFAEEGISKTGRSVIEGEIAEANRDSEKGARIRKDLGDAFSIMNALPATDVKEFDGGSYRPGVYSALSGRLSGEIILDAGNDPNAIFIFKVGSALRTESDLHFSLINGAAAQNIFFIAKGTATVGEQIDFKGSILAEETISVGAGSKVNGRTLSLGGEVKLTDAAVAGGTGVLEICKEAVEAGLTVYGVTTNNILFSFNSNSPNNIDVIGPIFGTGGAAIVGIDFRPATSFIIIQPEGPILGVLYGVGSDNNLYTINQFTGGATLVGPLGVALAGTNFGVDFNPVTDLLRVTSDTGQNLSVNPNTGAATAQTPLNSAAQNPELGISGSAYSNNRQGAVTTTLYDIDTDADTLVTQVPATGVITTVGSLGINALAVNGFDISEVNNTALAAITTVPAGETGSALYRINLTTGAATFVGNIAVPSALGVRGLAIAPGGSTGLGNPNGLDNRIFQFTVGGQTVTVPVGACSGPITLPAGPVTITELNDGFLIPTGTFSGRFRLVDVTSNVPGSLGTVNLPARTAVVNIREGGFNLQTVVTFFNTFAVPAIIEICKRPALAVPNGGGVPTGADVVDIPVGTPFEFTVDAILNTTFTVPVGFCSGPIQVLVTTTPGPFPAAADVIVTELGQPGFQMETATTFPADRLNYIQLGFGIDNSNPDCINANETPFVAIPPECIISNPGGGLVSGDVLEGGVASQTTFNFFNRPLPAIMKVCKIAGPGIPIGTPFTFEVRGTISTNPPVFQDPPFPPFSIGVLGLRNLTVQAGPAAQGGFCEFVRNLDGSLTRFVVGTPIAVNETGFTTPIPGVGPGQVRTSSIRSSSGFVGTTNPAGSGTITAIAVGNATTASNLPPFALPAGIVSLSTANGGNPDYDFPPNQPNRFLGSAAIVPARVEKTEVEFTNFVFVPGILKICKVAGAGIADDGSRLFTFRTTIINPPTLQGGLFDPRLITPIADVVVAAGPASQGGFCQFVQGPFTPTATNPSIGTFPVGQTVEVTELGTGGATGTTTTAITSPTGTVTNVNLGTRTGRLVISVPVPGFNEISFTNIVTPGPQGERAEFDFDGDGKSDPTIFRAATSTWWYAASSANGAHRATEFGLPQDKDSLVADDYDGDGKTDYAVYRREGNYGIWHIKASTAGVRAEQFGLATDIPQTGDFDGDGKADLAVFRPSNGVWYVMNSSKGFSAVHFGATGDKPVAADYDGDGSTDMAVYRGEGIWHLLRSRDGYTSIKFGLATDIDTPVAADYDGDGKADLAVFRNGGTWHLLRSQAGYTSYQFGTTGDKPVPADYNGDGKTDLAVFRGGTWHLLSSGQGEAGSSYSSFGFGNESDTPVPER